MKESPASTSPPTGRLLATTLVGELKKKPGVWHDLELGEIVELPVDNGRRRGRVLSHGLVTA